MDESICIICNASFRPNVMVGDKCSYCNTLYPKAKSRKDIINPNKNKAETLTESRVKDIIYEILEDANLKRVKCEKCEKLFFKRGPAQKYCSACKNKEKK